MARCRTVIVVDDEDDFRDDIVGLLLDHGYQTLGFATGAAALRHLRDQPPGDAMVILDLLMEAPDGWQILSELRRDGLLSRTPVVVMTGHADQERVLARSGIAAFLHKPFDPQAVLLLAAKHCAQGVIAP